MEVRNSLKTMSLDANGLLQCLNVKENRVSSLHGLRIHVPWGSVATLAEHAFETSLSNQR